MSDILQEELEDLVKDLQDAQDVLNEQPPPLDRTEKVMGHMEAAYAHVDLILDPAQQPKLVPPDAGAILAGYPSEPGTLESHVDDALELATCAAENVGEEPDYDVIGSSLKTIGGPVRDAITEALGA